MKFLTSHKGAMLITFLVVALSILFGSHRSLTAARGEVEQVYLNGSGDGGSVFKDLDAYWATASNLASVAGRYLPDARELVDLRAALDGAARTMDDIEDHHAYRKLRTAAGQVSIALDGVTLSDKDAQYVRRFQSELESRAYSIANDGYNDLAQDFNRRVLGGFPANLLSRLVSVPPMAVFH